jgi:hypothetical protein
MLTGQTRSPGRPASSAERRDSSGAGGDDDGPGADRGPVVEAPWCRLRSDIGGVLLTLAAVLAVAIVTD